MRRNNRYTEAFKEQFNLVSLASAAALSAALLNPLPLLAAVVAEAAYLLFVPDSKWYDVRLSRKFDAEVERRRLQLRNQVFPTLRPDLQTRFTRLESIRKQIGSQTVEGQTWFLEVLRKLDYLLEKFLMFAGKEAQFRSYLESNANDAGANFSRPLPRNQDKRKIKVNFDYEFDDDSRLQKPSTGAPANSDMNLDPNDRRVKELVGNIQAHYDKEMESVKQMMQANQTSDTKAVLEKRLDVIQRRREFIAKIGDILINLNHQLCLVEDTFGLINDEMRARTPEQILSDIEDVVFQTNSMTQVLEELASYDQMVARLDVQS